jgi:hypothetical protein
MGKFIPTLFFLLFFATICNAQRGRSKPAEVYYYVDNCAVPYPKKAKATIAANFRSVTTPNFNKVNRANPKNYPKPVLSVKIRLTKNYIYHFNDLKLVLTIKNETNRDQTFMFDKYDGATTILFETACSITNSYGRSIVKHPNKAILDTLTYYKHIESYYYTLQPSEWLLKEYSVSHLVVLDTTICKKGKLPAGSYTLQLNLQDNLSNEVTFQAE